MNLDRPSDADMSSQGILKQSAKNPEEFSTTWVQGGGLFISIHICTYIYIYMYTFINQAAPMSMGPGDEAGRAG